MANWQDVGKNNLSDAVLLLDNKKYRSAISRFYYAVFAALTFELIRRGASGDFGNNKNTPGHAQLPGLTEKWFTHLSEERRKNLVLQIGELYRSRIASDYSGERVSRASCQTAYRTVLSIFKILGMKT